MPQTSHQDIHRYDEHSTLNARLLTLVGWCIGCFGEDYGQVTGARRQWLRLATTAAIASAFVAVPSVSLAAPPDEGAPPDFQAAWTCGETWYGSTYPDHGNGDRALDFNDADDAEAGEVVLASAPGVVHASDTEFFEPSDRRIDEDGDLRLADGTAIHVGDGAEVSLWRFNGQIYIDHGNGWYSFYAHLDPTMPSVEDGAQVDTGDALGYVDQDPNPLMASGAHLHYEQKRDGKPPFSVYEAKTQRMRLDGQTLPSTGESNFVGVMSRNCGTAGGAGDLALQPTGFVDDLVTIRGLGSDALGFRRYLVDGAAPVSTNRERMNVRPTRAGDRALAGDFTNDGIDDIALVIQQRDGSFQIRVWSEGRYRVGSYLDPGYPYSLALNQGRTAAGDFDGDGFTDDIVMARDIGSHRIRLVRFLFDGPDNVTVSRQRAAVAPSRVDDRMLVGDFTNDGIDDVAFVIQQADRSFQVKVWREADEAAGVFYDPGWQYSLRANQGRLISGDFDGDGYRDDIAMAKSLDPRHLGLRRYLFDGRQNVTASNEKIRIDPERAGDRMLRGDFDNDGSDDAAFLVRPPDGPFQLRVWSEAGEPVRDHLDAAWQHAFARAGGFVVSGNFDRG